jgi:hypothetical protein
MQFNTLKVCLLNSFYLFLKILRKVFLNWVHRTASQEGGWVTGVGRSKNTSIGNDSIIYEYYYLSKLLSA